MHREQRLTNLALVTVPEGVRRRQGRVRYQGLK
jgi:hypothetical protein